MGRRGEGGVRVGGGGELVLREVMGLVLSRCLRGSRYT